MLNLVYRTTYTDKKAMHIIKVYGPNFVYRDLGER